MLSVQTHHHRGPSLLHQHTPWLNLQTTLRLAVCGAALYHSGIQMVCPYDMPSAQRWPVRPYQTKVIMYDISS